MILTDVHALDAPLVNEIAVPSFSQSFFVVLLAKAINFVMGLRWLSIIGVEPLNIELNQLIHKNFRT